MDKRTWRFRRAIIAAVVTVALGLMLAPVSRTIAERDPTSWWSEYVQTAAAIFIITYLISGGYLGGRRSQ